MSAAMAGVRLGTALQVEAHVLPSGSCASCELHQGSESKLRVSSQFSAAPISVQSSSSWGMSQKSSSCLSYASSEFWGADNVQLSSQTGNSTSCSDMAGENRRRASSIRVMSVVEKKGTPGRFYFNVTGFPFPLGPFLQRRTIRKEVEKGRIWTFEQEQALGFSSVATNTRMTVIMLKSGGLWVHAPIAPTEECIQGDSF